MVSNSSAEPDGLKITFTVDQVRDKLLKLQENKSTGPGGYELATWQFLFALSFRSHTKVASYHKTGSWLTLVPVLRKAVNKMQKIPTSVTHISSWQDYGIANKRTSC